MSDIFSKAASGLLNLGLSSKGKYGIGFSGGPDSSFLLDILYKNGFRNLVLLYVNYHDSPFVDQEESTVKEKAAFYHVKLTKLDFTKTLKGNFESEARKVRYDFFLQEKEKQNLEGVFLAHQEDDLLLTYLMQKEKGVTVSYYGISPEVCYEKKLRIYRPILTVSKSEIIAYMKENNLSYYDDVTNNNTARTRNRLREEVLPTLDRKALRTEIDRRNGLTEEALAVLSPYIGSSVPYKLYQEAKEETQKRFLWLLLESKGLKEEELQASKNLCFEKLKRKSGTGVIQLRKGLALYRNSDSFYVMKFRKSEPYSYSLEKKSVYDFEEISIDLTDLSVFRSIRESDFPLKIRNVLKGDAFSTSIATKDVGKFIAANKVPAYLRSSYPVIENKEGQVIFAPFFADLLKNDFPLKIKGYYLK
jgi:bifunctional protein TilS/HprT